MAEDYQRVVDLPVKTSSGISLLSDYLMGIDANDGYQMLINDLAKKIVEDYVGSSLGGSSRTLKSALDAISTLLGSATMGTTAQTVTGAIAEHEGDISGIGTTIGNTSMGTTATTLTGAIAEHESDISTLNGKLGAKIGGLAIKYFDKAVTLPAGTTDNPSLTTIDLTSDLSAYGNILGITAFVGQYQLPYIEAGVTRTWIRIGQGKTITIANSAGAWNNYHAYIIAVVGYGE